MSADATRARYSLPQLFWRVGVALVCWLAHVRIKTSRYALRDYGSRVTILAMRVTMVGEHLPSLRSFA